MKKTLGDKLGPATQPCSLPGLTAASSPRLIKAGRGSVWLDLRHASATGNRGALMDGALELGIGVALTERARQKGSPSCQDSLTHCVGLGRGRWALSH